MNDKLKDLYLAIYILVLLLAIMLKPILFSIKKNEKRYLYKLSILVILSALLFSITVFGYCIFLGTV